MSSISVGDYTLEDKGNGKLTITEDSTGETVEIDGSNLGDVGIDKLLQDLDAGNQSITNLKSLSTEEINIGSVQTTAKDDGVSEINTRLSNLGADEALAVTHPVTTDGSGEQIKIPSDTTLIIQAPIKRADNVSGSGINLLQNSDFTNGNSNIKVIFLGGHLDGNSPKQPTGENSRFPMRFEFVDNLEFHNADIRNPYNWGVRLTSCTDVEFSNYHVETPSPAPTANEDGIHFVNCSDVVGHGLSGVSNDDFLAIEHNTKDIENYTISGIRAQSRNRDVVRILVNNGTTGNGNVKNIENITITDVVAKAPGENGLNVTGDADTYLKSVTVRGKCKESVGKGFDVGAANFEDCTFDWTVLNPGNRGVDLEGATSIDNCDIITKVRGLPSANKGVMVAAADDSTIDAKVYRASSDQYIQSVRLHNCTNCEVDVQLDGGSRGLHLLDSCVDNVVRGTIKNMTDLSILENGSTPDNNDIVVHGDESAMSFNLSGATTTRNGVGSESANAETPQNDWPEGTVVDFTDSGDGSGTGQYVLIGGSWIQLA